MHLVEALPSSASFLVRRDIAHKFPSSRELCAEFGQTDGQHGHFPAVVVAANAQAQGAADDLVAEAHADDAHAALPEDFLDEVDQPKDPGVVVERVVLCASDQTRPRCSPGSRTHLNRSLE